MNPEGVVSRLHQVLKGAQRDHCPRGSYRADVVLSQPPFSHLCDGMRHLGQVVPTGQTVGE